MMFKKKLLLIGKFHSDKSVYTYASSFHRTFERLGYNTKLFNCKKSFVPMFPKSHDCLHPKLKPANNILCNFFLKRKVLTFQPDIVFFLKSENITCSTIKEIKRQRSKCKLINFYPDNPFVFWNGNSNQEILKSLPLYDHFLIWSKSLIPVLQMAGSRNVSYFPLAYDDEIFNQKVVISDADQQRYKSDVCFVGTWDAEREWWLHQLCKSRPAINLAIWGNRWNECLSKNSILKKHLRGPAIYMNEMIKVFRCSRIVLNFIRKQNAAAHNMRVFEVMASKAFLLTQRTDELSQPPFAEQENIATFDSIEDLSKKIDFYLKENSLRKKIVESSFQLSQDFSIYEQLTRVFEIENL
jgi:spore maturation protein CgeB